MFAGNFVAYPELSEICMHKFPREVSDRRLDVTWKYAAISEPEADSH
jgi:hypothetical protein